MEGVTKEKLYDHLARLELGREAAQARFVVVRGSAEGELGAELFGGIVLISIGLIILWPALRAL